MHPEPRKRLACPCTEHGIIRPGIPHQRSQHGHSRGPEWADSPFVALAQNTHRCGGSKLQVTGGKSGSFIRSSPRVVQEQEKCVVASSECRASIGRP